MATAGSLCHSWRWPSRHVSFYAWRLSGSRGGTPHSQRRLIGLFYGGQSSIGNRRKSPSGSVHTGRSPGEDIWTRFRAPVFAKASASTSMSTQRMRLEPARLLSHAGFRRARVEIGWGEFSFTAPRPASRPAYYRIILRALVESGLRPLILLNSNHGLPCPARVFGLEVVAPARAGDRTIKLDTASRSKVVPGRTGLDAFAGEPAKAAAILFMSVSEDGTAKLSRPLEGNLQQGVYRATTLLHRPFQKPFAKDGGANPAFQETLAGWLRYVDATTRFVRSAVGSTKFDVEIWNELSFGSDFLDIDRYYHPPIDSGEGESSKAVLNSTVAFLRNSDLRPRIGIAHGFGSQTPFASGSTSPTGLSAIAKHPYAGLSSFSGRRDLRRGDSARCIRATRW